jgi:hypothetical protein
MASKRFNISMEEELHARAVIHAKEQHFTGFSELVTKLILEDIRQTLPLPPIHPEKAANAGAGAGAEAGPTSNVSSQPIASAIQTARALKQRGRSDSRGKGPRRTS